MHFIFNLHVLSYFYPILPIFLDGYILHIRDIFQLCLFPSCLWAYTGSSLHRDEPNLAVTLVMILQICIQLHVLD